MRLGVYDAGEALLADLKWTSEHFVGLPPTMSPHSLAVVHQRSGPVQLLVASSSKLFLIKSNGSGELVTQLLDLPCVGASTEIPSVAAHVDADSGELVYAFVACTKTREGSVSCSLHVHEARRGCHEVLLPSRPHLLLYSAVPCAGGDQGVWVLAGAQVAVVGPPMVAGDAPTEEEENQFPASVRSGRLAAAADAQVLLRADEGDNDDHSEDEEDENDDDDDDDDDEEEELHEEYWGDSHDHRSRDELGSPTGHFPPAKCRSPLRRRPDRGGAKGGSSGCSEKQENNTRCEGGGLRLLSTGQLFPELHGLPCTPVCVHTLTAPHHDRRITAVCGDDGSVMVFDVAFEEPLDSPSHYVTAEGSFLKGDMDKSPFTTPPAGAPPSVSTPQLPQQAPHAGKRPTPTNKSRRVFLPSLSPCNQESFESGEDFGRSEEGFSRNGEDSSRNGEGSSRNGEDSTPNGEDLLRNGSEFLQNGEDSSRNETGSPTSCEVVHALKATVRSVRKFQFEYPMSSVKLFRMTDLPEPYPDALPPLRGLRTPTPDPRTPLYSLLATSAVSRSYVLQDVLSETEMSSAALPESGDHDTVVCCLSAHLGGDRRRHLLLGTYGQTVLVYCADGGADEEQEDEGTWRLETRLLVGAPVLSLAFEDIVGDGVRRVLVLTADGLQVFVLEPQQVAAVLTQRLHQLLLSNSSCLPSGADLRAVTRSLDF